MNVPAKGIYIPANRSKAARPTERARLPHEVAIAPASRTFRQVAWTGAPTPEAALSTGRAGLGDLHGQTAARLAFATVAWSGEKPTPPTPTQEALSVQRFLASFKWE